MSSCWLRSGVTGSVCSNSSPLVRCATASTYAERSILRWPACHTYCTARWAVPPTLKVHGQLCRHVAYLGAMPCLQSCPNALVQPHPLRGRDPLIEHLLIQGMDKAIGASHRAVWPELFSARL